MKKELSVWLMLSVAVVLGSFSATALSGCTGNEAMPTTPAATSHDAAESPAIPQHDAPAAEPPAPDAAAPDAAAPAAENPEVELPPAEGDAPAAGDAPADKPEVEVPPIGDSAAVQGNGEEAGTLLVSADAADSSDGSAAPDSVLKAGGDWPQWGGTRLRNNTPNVENLPESWNTGKFNRTTGEWDSSKAVNIKWVSNLGSQTYGNPVVADGRVYVGTNNGAGHLARYPNDVDLGCLLAFNEADGALLWQHSSEKLITGRVHDWPLQGICCAPLVEGKRLWFVTSRGEVRCLDTEGFYDGEDDGPVKNEKGRVADWDIPQQPNTDDEEQLAAFNAAMADFQAMKNGLDAGEMTDKLRELLTKHGFAVEGQPEIKAVEAGKKWSIKATVEGVQRDMNAMLAGPRISFFKTITAADKQEADTIWILNMMDELGVSQHNMCSCSVTSYGDLLFVNTSNGLDESHINLPAPDAPSFICMDKNNGEVLWTNKAPGTNILHGQWSSPTVAELGGVPQVLFAGGDGWLYSFRADRGKDGQPEMLWKFDCNPKESKWILGGAGTRNNLIATPVVYDDLVYIAVGQDPEHGEGEGHLWCIDPTKRGDVSPQLAMQLVDGERKPMEHKRIQAVEPENGEAAIDNPNSAVVWHYSTFDQNEDGTIDFEEEMHRSCGTVTIKDDLLYIADFSGLVHCLDAKGTKDGQPIVHFTYDMLAQSWGSALIADGRVYIGDEDGDVAVFELGAENNEPIEEINMGSSVYSTPVAANGVMYISTKDKLFAIALEEEE